MTRRTSVAVAVLILALTAAPEAAVGQSTDDRKDVQGQLDRLRQQVDVLRKELDEVLAIPQIRALVEENRPLDADLSVAEAPYLGDQHAKLTLVEFSDFQCPYCARHVASTYPALKDRYVAEGTLKYVFMDFPLQNHPEAPKAAEAARCAGDQGQFWEMHDHLFANQSQLGQPQLLEHAGTLGLDATAFEACLTSGKYSDAVENDMAEGLRLRVRGTPSFGLGFTSMDGQSVRVVRLIRGAQPLAMFEQAIDEMLADPSGSN